VPHLRQNVNGTRIYVSPPRLAGQTYGVLPCYSGDSGSGRTLFVVGRMAGAPANTGKRPAPGGCGRRQSPSCSACSIVILPSLINLIRAR
jgi:hypothetical protein